MAGAAWSGLTLVGGVTFHLLVFRPVLKVGDGEGERAPLNRAPDRLPCPARDDRDRGPAGGIRGSADRPGVGGVRVLDSPLCLAAPYGICCSVRSGDACGCGVSHLAAASAIAVIVAWRRGRQRRAGDTRRRAGRGGTADDQPDQSRGRDRQCAI